MSGHPEADPDTSDRQSIANLKMGFVGVSTAGSSIMTIFPRWARELGLPTQRLVSHDLPLGASRSAYQELVTEIRDDPGHLGALVTTHKIGLFNAAADLFDDVDEFARLCGEVSSISKRGDRLVAHAKDPVTAGLSMDEFLPADHFRTAGAEVVCLGAGGAGTAISWRLAHRADRPSRIVCSDRDVERLTHLRDVHIAGGLDTDLFSYVHAVAAGDSDRLVSGAPPGSLIINATGLGKDRPGSPLTDETCFPRRSHVWELNYRGSLEFLIQAKSQEQSRELAIVDGWRYFIHGWTQVIAEVFDRRLDTPTVNRLSELAQNLR